MLAVVNFGRQESDERVIRLIDQRHQARAAKDFRKADALRDELLSLGVRVKDSPTGNE